MSILCVERKVTLGKLSNAYVYLRNVTICFLNMGKIYTSLYVCENLSAVRYIKKMWVWKQTHKVKENKKEMLTLKWKSN